MLAFSENESLLDSERRQNRSHSGLTCQSLAQCKRLREARHNSRTCENDTTVID
jgi:hypothetical protein